MKTFILVLFSFTAFGQYTAKEYTDNQMQWMKVYVDSEVDALKRSQDRVAIANENAIDKVETTYADYRAQQNEWRGQSKDREGTFVTRAELLAWASAIVGFMLGAVGFILRLKPQISTPQIETK